MSRTQLTAAERKRVNAAAREVRGMLGKKGGGAATAKRSAGLTGLPKLLAAVVAGLAAWFAVALVMGVETDSPASQVKVNSALVALGMLFLVFGMVVFGLAARGLVLALILSLGSFFLVNNAAPAVERQLTVAYNSTARLVNTPLLPLR